jgi:hypothetical protein
MCAGARLSFALALLAAAPGCVHVYQPLSGLHRPVVVDPQAANFQDLRLLVVCPPGGLVSPGEAQVLCERVGKLFENQGATVTTATDGRPGDPGLEQDPAEANAAVAAAPTTDLVLELRAHQIHTTNDPLSWVLCLATATLVPAYSESTFAQDVVIRDATGFLLVSDVLEGRIVRTFGLGTWAGNKLLDLVWRKKEDELSTKAVHADLSADLYGQLSQLVFNAKMRWQVLQEATPNGRATSVVKSAVGSGRAP